MLNSLKILTVCSLLVLFAIQAHAFGNRSGQPGASSAPSVERVGMKGTVVETMNSGGYTYACVKNGDQKQWVAMPESEVKVGQEVTVAPGMVMHNFSSKTLNRSFESIIFSQGITKP